MSPSGDLKLPLSRSDYQSRPFPGSWVASTDCVNVTPGQSKYNLHSVHLGGPEKKQIWEHRQFPTDEQ